MFSLSCLLAFFFSLFHFLTSFTFFLHFFFFFHFPRRLSLFESRKEWCWSSCSLCHLHILTSLTNDSQVIDQKISRSEVQRSMPPDGPRSEANQNSAKVQYSFTFYFSHLSLFLLGFLLFFFKFPPLQRLFFFFFLMSLSVQWIICLLLANIMPLLTGLTGSQSHTMQNRSWTWLWSSCSSFSNFHYRGNVINKTDNVFFFAVVMLALVSLREIL